MRNIAQRGRLIALATGVIALPFSIVVCHAALLTALFCILLERNWMTSGAWLRHPLIFASGLFFLLHLIGMAYTNDLTSGWSSVEKKAGLILIPLGLAATNRLNRRELEILLWAFIGTCVVASIVCFVAASKNFAGSIAKTEHLPSLYFQLHGNASVAWPYFSYESLSSVITMSPTYLSMYLLFSIVALMQVASASGTLNRWPIILLAMYLLSVIVCLSSKVVIVATFLILPVVVFIWTGGRTRFARVAAAGISVALLIAAVYLHPVSRFRTFEEPFSSHYPFPPPSFTDATTNMRASLIWTAIKSAQTINPVWGAGTGDVDEVMRSTAANFSIYNSLGATDPHNQFLTTLLALGLTGLVTLTACFVLPIWQAFRRRNWTHLLFLFLFVLVCLTDSTFEFQKGIVFYSVYNSLFVFHDEG